MKATKIIIIAICLFVTGQVFAAGSKSIKDRVDLWLQDSSDQDNSNEGGLRGDRIGTETEDGDLQVSVHGGLLVLTVLAGGYMCRKKLTS